MHSPVLLSFIFLVIGIVVLWIIYRIARNAWLLVLPAALLIYAVFDFELYRVLRIVFWLAVLVGVVTFVIMLFFCTYSLRTIFRAASATALVIALLALTFGTFSWNDLLFGENMSGRGLNNGTSVTSTVAPSTSNTLAPSTTSVTCPGSWSVQKSDNTNNRWFFEGIQAISTAKSVADARKAAEVWIGKVKADPVLLSGASAIVLHEVVDPSTLVNGNCMSSDAVSRAKRVEDEIAKGKVEVGMAPANGTNSGVAAGAVVIAPSSGITGDRTAIKVTLQDGTVFWVLARCGNPVTTTPPKLPPGPTDEKPPPSTTTTTICASGKCVPPSTLAPPPTTVTPPSTTTKVTTTTLSIPATTWQPPPTSRPDSGVGAPPTSTIVVPTTVAPQATVPATTAPPTTRVSY